jgi:hypothetical protein
MSWHDFLALALFAAAAGFVVTRAYHVLFARGKSGCGSGCGSCQSSDSAAPPATLVSIGQPPDVRPTQRS